MPFTFEKNFKSPYFTDFAPNETFLNSLLGISCFAIKTDKELNIKINNWLEKYLKIGPCNTTYFFSARLGLLALLKALNLKRGGKVLIPAFTCSTVILPFLKLGIKPVFVDIEKETFSINPIDLSKKINNKTNILLLQHTYGFTPAKRNQILSIIKEKNILLIEDIAHTIKPIKFDYKKDKQFYLLSFGRSKALSSVFGGAVILKNKRVRERLKKIANKLPKADLKLLFQIMLYKLTTPIIKTSYAWGFGKALLKLAKNIFPPEISKKEKNGKFDKRYNLQFSKLQKAFLLAQLEKYENIAQMRIKKANELLQKIPEKYLPKSLAGKTIKEPIIRLPLLVNDPEKLLKKLKKKNIFLGRWYYQPIIGIKNPEKLGYKKGSCPKAEEVGERIVTIGL